MAKEKLEEISTDRLNKKLLLANIFAVILGITAITITVFYFLGDKSKYDLLIIGAGLGVALSSFQGTVANKIRKEIKSREET